MKMFVMIVTLSLNTSIPNILSISEILLRLFKRYLNYNSIFLRVVATLAHYKKTGMRDSSIPQYKQIEFSTSSILYRAMLVTIPFYTFLECTYLAHFKGWCTFIF